MNQSRLLLRLLAAVLVVVLLTNGLPGPLGEPNIVAADDTGIIVEDAHSVETLDLLPDQDLLDAASSVDLRCVVEYAHSLRHYNLVTLPPDLAAGLSLVSPRVVIEYANSVRHQDLISPPPSFGDAASKVGPRIVVEYAHSVLYHGLERPEEVPEDVAPFNYPLYHPWTDTLGFGQGWSTYLGHLGQDYAAPTGTPVYAVASGEVVLRHDDPYPGEMKGWGNALIISHDVSESQTVYSQYAHFQDMVVDEGDLVELGQQIGTIGQTGFATGPHLHLEIKDTPSLGPGFAGYSFTGDSRTHGGVTYYRPSTFIEQRRGFTAGDELAVTGTGGVGLRLRSSPAISSDNILTVMPEGSQINVIGGPTIAHGYGWWQVQFGALQGWAAGRYLASTEGQVAPDLPTSLAQYTVDDTPVPPGGDIEDTRIVLKGTVTSPAGGLVKLQVEVRREGQAFTRHTHEGPLVASGQQASVTVGDLAVGAYQWRARAVSAGGMTSDWVNFSTEPQADFIVLPVLAARFSFYPSHPVPGEEVEFDASASHPSWRIVSYQWDFPDGHTATGKVVHHQFSETGNYDVSLTVEFDDARTASITHQVSVVSKTLLEAVDAFVDDAIRDLDAIVDTAEELAAAADYFRPRDKDLARIGIKMVYTALISPWPLPDLGEIFDLVVPFTKHMSVEMAADEFVDLWYGGKESPQQSHQSMLVNPLRNTVDNYKTELLSLRDEALAEMATVPPEHMGTLRFDLSRRTPGNTMLEHYARYRSHYPLRMKEVKQHQEESWSYQAKKTIFYALVGTATFLGIKAIAPLVGGGLIVKAVLGGATGAASIIETVGSYIAQLNQDEEMNAAAHSSFLNALFQTQSIYENTKDGLENVRQTAAGASPPPVPRGEISSVEHVLEHAIEQSFWFFDIAWWPREAYSEVTIKNTGSRETDYWLYVVTDRWVPSDRWLYFIPVAYVRVLVVQDDSITGLSAGSDSEPVRFTYLDREEGGFDPREARDMIFNLLARGEGEATYAAQSKRSTFGTILTTLHGEVISEEELDGVGIYMYPFRSQIAEGPEPGDYTLTIFVSNPTESLLMAQLTQPLPVQGEVVWDDGGIANADSITWELQLEASAVAVLEVAFTGVTDSPFEIPAGHYDIYDVINDNWVTFDSDPLMIEIPLTVTTTELPDGAVGVDYETTLESFGGTPSYSWEWTAQEEGQEFPPGLDLSPDTGVISGTPTEAGTFNFTVEVTDAEEDTATRELSISIAEELPYQAITALTPGRAAGDCAGSVARIIEVQNVEGDPVAVDVGSYEATLSYDGALLNVLEVRHDPSFPGDATIDNATGTTSFNGTATEGVACPCDLAFLPLRLTGTALEPVTATLTFSDIRDGGGNPIGQILPAAENTFLRGDANADGAVDIGDVLYIAQYLAGLREVGMGEGEVHPVNAASVAHNGDCDKINISDALFIAQYLAGVRGPDYGWLAP